MRCRASSIGAVTPIPPRAWPRETRSALPQSVGSPTQTLGTRRCTDHPARNALRVMRAHPHWHRHLQHRRDSLHDKAFDTIATVSCWTWSRTCTADPRLVAPAQSRWPRCSGAPRVSPRHRRRAARRSPASPTPDTRGRSDHSSRRGLAEFLGRITSAPIAATGDEGPPPRTITSPCKLSGALMRVTAIGPFSSVGRATDF